MIKNSFSVFSRVFKFLSAGNLMSDILALTVVALLLTGIYMKGRSDSSIACAERQTAGVERVIKEHAKTRRTVTQMPKSDLDRELSKWMRD